MAYNLMSDGTLKFKSKLIDFGTSLADGMTVDVEGNLYLAGGDKVSIFTPEGKKITEIKVPAASNVCFGRGQFSKTLFVTAGKSIYSFETKKEGYNLLIKK